VEGSSRFRKIFLAFVSLLLIAFIALWFRYKLAPDAVSEVRSAPVSAVRPQIHDLRNELILTAVLEAESMVTVLPRVSGTILEIPVEEGDHIEEGDLLARIDSEAYLFELKAAEAAWLVADSSFTRLNSIRDNSGVSLQQLDEAKASRDKALSAYELAQMKYSYAVITSPVSGLLLKKYSDPGNTASPGQPLFLIGESGNPRVRVRVPEKYWKSFTGPEPLRVLVSYPAGGDNRKKEFEISRVSPDISPESKTFEVLCSISADDNPWPVGAGVRVEFILEERTDSWSLPLKALSADGALWLIDPDSSRVSRIFLSDIFRDKQRVAIPEELSSGLYVLDGQHLLSEGLIVTVFDAGG